MQMLRNNNTMLTTALEESTQHVSEWKRQLQKYKEECDSWKKRVSYNGTDFVMATKQCMSLGCMLKLPFWMASISQLEVVSAAQSKCLSTLS